MDRERDRDRLKSKGLERETYMIDLTSWLCVIYEGKVLAEPIFAKINVGGGMLSRESEEVDQTVIRLLFNLLKVGNYSYFRNSANNLIIPFS